VSIEQVLKWDKGNDLWDTVLLAPSNSDSSLTDAYLHAGIPPKVKDIIHEYGSLFQEPTTLPRSRIYDHAITSLPNAISVNCRPYRHSLEQ
jgi:hypothetical protein